MAAHSDLVGGFACHKTIEVDGEWTERTRVCRGSLHSANESAKTYSDPELHALQVEAGKNPDVMNAWEFIAYHKGNFI